MKIQERFVFWLGLTLALGCVAQEQAIFPLKVLGKWGYINQAGKMAVQPLFDEAEEFHNRPLARIRRDDKWGALDRQGKIAIEPQFQNLYTCLADSPLPALIGGKWGYVDAAGRSLIEPKYEQAECFSNDGLAPVRIDGKWGLIDRSEKVVMPPKFESLSRRSEKNLVLVLLGGKYGFADIHGNVRIDPIYDDAGHFNEFGLADVRQNWKHGVIDQQGRMVVAPRFEYQLIFGANGLAPARLGGKDGYIDTHGEMVIQPRFDHARVFSENGLAPAEIDRKFGYIDTQGHFVIEPRFDDAFNFYRPDNRAMVRLGRQWAQIDEKGQFVIPPKYETLLAFNQSGLAGVEMQGMRGYIDKRGETVAMVVEGCGSAVVLGKGNAVSWIPGGRQGPELRDCILWERAVRDVDPGKMKSLLAAGVRPQVDDAALIQVVKTSASFDRAEQAQAAQADFDRRQDEAIRLLVAQGANRNAVVHAGAGQDRPLVVEAIVGWHTAAALTLLDLGADASGSKCRLTSRNCDTTPLVTEALTRKNQALTAGLLKQGADANAPDKDGRTPLGYVLYYQPSLARRMCARHSDGREDCKDVPPETYDRQKWLGLLLKYGADPNRRTQDMWPLMATRKGDSESIHLLVDHGARLGAPPGKRRLYGKEREIGPVTWALDSGRDDLLPLAIKQANGSLEANDRYAIALAVDGNRPEIVTALLDSGADARLSIEETGLTLLHSAAWRGHLEVARRLIRGGARVDARSQLPADLPWPKSVLEKLPIDNHFTPLMLASKAGRPDMLRLLLASGANAKIATDQGQTALSLATGAETIRLLQEYGAAGK